MDPVRRQGLIRFYKKQLGLRQNSFRMPNKFDFGARFVGMAAGVAGNRIRKEVMQWEYPESDIIAGLAGGYVGNKVFQKVRDTGVRGFATIFRGRLLQAFAASGTGAAVGFLYELGMAGTEDWRDQVSMNFSKTLGAVDDFIIDKGLDLSENTDIVSMVPTSSPYPKFILHDHDAQNAWQIDIAPSSVGGGDYIYIRNLNTGEAYHRHKNAHHSAPWKAAPAEMIEIELDGAWDNAITVPGKEDLLEELDAIAEEAAAPEYCFAADTPIQMADGAFKPIQDVALGDEVAAFSDVTDGVQPAKVIQLHRTEAQEVIDFHGVEVTPGHVFLSGDGAYKKLEDILAEDGTVVGEDGTLLRARTGAPVGGTDDIVIPVGYKSGDAVKIAHMRAGTPYGVKDGRSVSILEMMRDRGYHLRSDGRFVNIDGHVVTAWWEWGQPEAGQVAVA